MVFSLLSTDKYQPPTEPEIPLIVYVLLSYCRGEPVTPAARPDTEGPSFAD